ncbi:rhamnose ABC transporter substrate-binding protein [Arthrobacter dokdonensis]|uniref:rhamnose ABC transporter substrate-binding protein n=1 Tax=Arthrobacter dokdonellae TaxID=2211210 RepID=UPI001D13255A|nr:rhamnose ABC transporter substrate-binding protein [Arthrobacter dokdonellae]
MMSHLKAGRKPSRLLGLAAGVLGFALILTGCSSGGGSPSASGGSKNYKITFLPKSLGNNYFQASDGDGGKSAVTAFGGTYQEVGPTAATASAQVSYINTLTQQHVGAIVLSANDPSALCTSLKQAMTAGVKVVTFDSDVNPDCRNVFVNQASTQGIAQAQADNIAKEIGGKGDIAILSATANATNQNAWNKAMIAYIGTKYPDLKVVTTVYGNDDDQTSYDDTAALVQKYPNLKGIVSPTTVGIAAAARYLSTSQYKGKIALTGLGTPNAMRAYIKDGTVGSFALWNPSDLGYLAAYTAKALIDGTITGKDGDSFKAGKLGEYKVGPDGTVLLGKPTTFDKSNIGKFNF